MKCSGPKKGVRTCTAGKRSFKLHPGKRRRSRNTRGIRAYRFTKADARSCRQKDPKARGKCMAKRVEARVG